MRVTNITDKSGAGVKVIGFANGISVMPGETKELPDSVAYVKIGGKKTVAPVFQTLARLGQIMFEEGPAPAAEPESVSAVEPDPAPDTGEDEKPVLTDEEKKAAAAAKRAAAREAKKAAAKAE